MTEEWPRGLRRVRQSHQGRACNEAKEACVVVQHGRYLAEQPTPEQACKYVVRVHQIKSPPPPRDISNTRRNNISPERTPLTRHQLLFPTNVSAHSKVDTEYAGDVPPSSPPHPRALLVSAAATAARRREPPGRPARWRRRRPSREGPSSAWARSRRWGRWCWCRCWCRRRRWGWW